MTKREWKLAIPILMLMLLCLASYLYGQHLENSASRITALRVLNTPQGERVAVLVNTTLHVLDADGHRLARQNLQAQGLTESPNDMDWTVDQQQQVQAWFFDDAVPRVLQCTWNAQQLALADCRNAMAGPQLKTNAHSLAVHLAVDSTGQRIFIADAKGHRVQVFDLAGKALTRTDPDRVPLYFPNRLRYVGNDILVVADNDHRRLAWLQVTPGQPPKLLRTLDSAAHGQARAGRAKVADVAFSPAGTVWMLAVKQAQKDGDVLVFDAKLHAVARAALPDGADPLWLDALGETALVADYSRINLSRIDAQGRYLGEFGDAAFRAELAVLSVQLRQGDRFKTGALIVGGLVILVGLLLGLLYGEKPKQPGQFDAQAKAALAILSQGEDSLRFPVVLTPTAAYQASGRKQLLVMALFMVVMMAVLGMPLSNLYFTGKLAGQRLVLALVAVGILLPLAALWATWREYHQSSELRVTQHSVGWFRDGKLLHAAPIQEVYASSNALLVGPKLIRFRAAGAMARVGQVRFDMDLLNRAVLSRLPPQNLSNDQALAWRVLKNSSVTFKLIYGVLMVVALLVAVYPYFR